MNYQKMYNSIINNALARTKLPGYERHHILPVSCGGSNTKDNLVYLKTREHYICHMLLVKIYKDNIVFRKKMIYALWWMSKTRNKLNGYRVTSHAYANSRKLYNEQHPNRDEEKKKKFLENHKAGNYNYDYKKVGNTLKSTLNKLSKEEMAERMKKSALSADQKLRRLAIQRAKASSFLLTTPTGETKQFYTYDDVLSITGYSYIHILYRIKAHTGVLKDGSVVTYIKKYESEQWKK
jgi:hypothetical protein